MHSYIYHSLSETRSWFCGAVRCVSVCKCVSELELTHVAYIYMYKDVRSGLVDRQSLSCSGSDGTIWGWNGSALVEGKANLVQMGKTPAGVRWSCNLFGHELSERVCMVDHSLCPTPPEKLFLTEISFLALPFAYLFELQWTDLLLCDLFEFKMVHDIFWFVCKRIYLFHLL